MTALIHKATGISVHVYKPSIILQGTSPEMTVMDPKGQHLWELDEELEGLSFSQAALGGYESASFSLSTNLNDWLRWLQDGLGSHVEMIASEGDTLWDGEISGLQFTIGALVISVESIADMGNRILVSYSTIDTSTEPPTLGVTTYTDYAENLQSICLFGVLPIIYSMSGATQTNAEQLRDMRLERMAWPILTHRVSLGASGDACTVSVKCRGYFERLRFPYLHTGTGQVNLDVKIGQILDAEPNALFAGERQLTTNALQVTQYEGKLIDAWGIIKELVACGDAAFARYIFQVLANRKVVYGPVSETPYYHLQVADQGSRVRLANESVIDPWRVKAGVWARYTDLMLNLTQGLDMRQDPTAMFIERVSFTAPNSVSLEGGHADRYSQLIGQMGLSGVGD